LTAHPAVAFHRVYLLLAIPRGPEARFEEVDRAARKDHSRETPFPLSPAEQIVTYTAVNPDSRTDNAWQWNATVQRQLPSNTIVEAGYIGTKGTHLLANRNINALIPAGGTLVRRYPGFADITRNGLNDANSTYPPSSSRCGSGKPPYYLASEYNGRHDGDN